MYTARNLVAFSLVALTLSSPAHAADFPRYDPEPHCERLAGDDAARMEAVYQGCIRQEGAAYEWIDDQWKSLPSAIKKSCLESNTQESYHAMRNCILAEKARASSQ